MINKRLVFYLFYCPLFSLLISSMPAPALQTDCFWDYEECTLLAEEYLLQDQVLTGADGPTDKSMRQYINAMRSCADEYHDCPRE